MAIKITNTYLQNLKPRDKDYRISDYIPGLYIRVLVSGSLVWDFRYISPITKKRHWLALGFYRKGNSKNVIISIAEARNKAEQLYELIQSGDDPKIEKRNTLFKTLYAEWHAKRKKLKLNKKHVDAMHSATTRYILPHLGDTPIEEIKPFMIADALRDLEKEGLLATLGKVKSNLNLMFRDWVVRGYIHENTAQQIPRSAFETKEPIAQRHLRLDQIYLLHQYLQNENASLLIRLAVEFIARTGLRANEACQALWEEFDEEHQVLSIYKGRMKNRKEHLVPLSWQSSEIIKKLRELGTDKTEYLFFDPTSKTGHLHLEAPRNSLKNYKVPTTAHGLRHLFSTLLNEVMTVDANLIESCLSHTPRKTSRVNYNKAQLVMPMREAFQEYSDHLDSCKTKEDNLQWIKDNNIILLNSKNL